MPKNGSKSYAEFYLDAKFVISMPSQIRFRGVRLIYSSMYAMQGIQKFYSEVILYLLVHIPKSPTRANLILLDRHVPAYPARRCERVCGASNLG